MKDIGLVSHSHMVQGKFCLMDRMIKNKTFTFIVHHSQVDKTFIGKSNDTIIKKGKNYPY